MMPPSNLSLALDAVCDAPEEELQHHLRKAQNAFQKLQSLLGGQNSSPLPHRQNGPSASKDEILQPTSGEPPPPVQSRAASFLPGSSSQPGAIQHPFSQDLPSTSYEPLSNAGQVTLHHDPSYSGHFLVGLPPHAALLDKLQGKYQQIEIFLRDKASKSVTEEPTSREEDPRVLDIRMCDRRKVTKEQQFLRTLGQRSLAKDFDRWASAKYGRSRVDELVETLDSTENAAGRIREFVRETVDVNDESVAARAIAHGIRLLVIETLTGFCGTSALLSFVFGDVRDLKYSSCSDLATLLNTCHDTRLYDLAERTSRWLVAWQDIYDEKRIYEHSCRKRRRLNDGERHELSQHTARWSNRLAAVATNVSNSAEPSNRKTFVRELWSEDERNQSMDTSNKQRSQSHVGSSTGGNSSKTLPHIASALLSNTSDTPSPARGVLATSQPQRQQHSPRTQAPSYNGLDVLIQAANFRRNSGVLGQSDVHVARMSLHSSASNDPTTGTLQTQTTTNSATQSPYYQQTVWPTQDHVYPVNTYDLQHLRNPSSPQLGISHPEIHNTNRTHVLNDTASAFLDTSTGKEGAVSSNQEAMIASDQEGPSALNDTQDMDVFQGLDFFELTGQGWWQPLGPDYAY